MAIHFTLYCDSLYLKEDGTGELLHGPSGCMIFPPRAISAWHVEGSALTLVVAKVEACVIEDPDSHELDEIRFQQH